ncbi:cytochrome c oxidase assembly protein [Granulicella tundricola]|uniref:Cytochrome c oxidase caa3-type, assembly factor CtaG-related protein n=1 Tax=Granulicella tundricola (strain ATCC BAA-1859 / DSM 23138 / MP5ACTX9) TaxID=1198114 RepID=E8X2H7_GRATM|nr:cytochrome c oxidase assembly protein [Granulicella tundricola]ADW69201.1 Cytochrome c oxidase caa3-type, assembly factor CtaG-related protein [Granulicella tundricola MP5ACTX9]
MISAVLITSPDLIGDWTPPLFLTATCILTIALYLRGFSLLRRTRPTFSSLRAASFCAGILVLWLALASPLEELADTVLTAHMIEHLLLMSAVPPLVLIGWPVVPMLRGLPLWLRRSLVHPLLRSRLIRAVLHWLDSPLVAWLLMNATLLLWHLPKAYDFALEHEGWHDFEHICFLATSLGFWWILLRPWPATARSASWGFLAYLLSADFVNTGLSATLAFIGHPVYAYYLNHTNPLGMDPLMDQQVGASIMWVFGSMAFLLPALVLAARMLSGGSRDERKSSQLYEREPARIVRDLKNP